MHLCRQMEYQSIQPHGLGGHEALQTKVSVARYRSFYRGVILFGTVIKLFIKQQYHTYIHYIKRLVFILHISALILYTRNALFERSAANYRWIHIYIYCISSHSGASFAPSMISHQAYGGCRNLGRTFPSQSVWTVVGFLGLSSWSLVQFLPQIWGWRI